METLTTDQSVGNIIKDKSGGGAPYYCYIIANEKRTYNGYTNNLSRRLRQHNGEIKGGAKATHNRKDGMWKYIAIITNPEWTAQRAMQVEYWVKYPTRKKPRPKEYCTPVGRIKSLKNIFENISDNVVIYIHPDFLETALEIGVPHVTLADIYEILPGPSEIKSQSIVAKQSQWIPPNSPEALPSEN